MDFTINRSFTRSCGFVVVLYASTYLSYTRNNAIFCFIIPKPERLKFTFYDT
jgi:hypothetical protein